MKPSEVLSIERAGLCDTLERLGPDAPTLCEGWTTADLAAHLVVRERRPDAGPGILFSGSFLGRHTAGVMDSTKARGYTWMIDRLRSGPPFPHRIGPAATVNVNESWIHHEDARRANGEGPRPVTPDLDAVLWRALGLTHRLGMRKVPVGVEAETPDGNRRTLRKGDPVVVIHGDAGEIVLYCSGRRDAAVVQLSGSDDALAALADASLGL